MFEQSTLAESFLADFEESSDEENVEGAQDSIFNAHALQVNQGDGDGDGDGDEDGKGNLNGEVSNDIVMGDGDGAANVKDGVPASVSKKSNLIQSGRLVEHLEVNDDGDGDGNGNGNGNGSHVKVMVVR